MSLSLSFPICELETMTVPPPWAAVRINWHEATGTVKEHCRALGARARGDHHVGGIRQGPGVEDGKVRTSEVGGLPSQGRVFTVNSHSGPHSSGQVGHG